MVAKRGMFAILVPALAALGLTLAGCGRVTDDSVVATVNGTPIKVGYLEAKWAKMVANDPTLFPDSLKLEEVQDKVLETLIKKELLVDKARKEGYVDDETYQKAYKSQLNYRLIELLKNKEIVDKIPKFTDEQIHDQYKYLGHQADARHIEVDTEEEAEDIYGKIKAGEMSFNDAVLEYSTNQDRTSGGKMPKIAFGTSVESVENAIFHMKEGEISEPIKVPNGYAILILDKMTVQDPPPYEQVKDQVKKRLEVRAMRSIGDAHGQKVLKKYGFKFHWDVAAEIVPLMPDDMTPSQLKNPPKFEKPILKFTDEQKAKVLYEIEGEKHTLGDFSDTYDEMSIYERPTKASHINGIFNKIKHDMINRVMPKEARSQNLEKDPDLIVKMKEFEEQNCIGAVKRMLVDAPLKLSDEDNRTFYEEHPLLYTRKYAMICKQLITNTEDDIRKAYSRVENGESFDSVGADLSLTWPKKWQTDWFTPDSIVYPDNEVFRQVLHLKKEGEYTPPFTYQGYWAVFQMVKQSDPVLLPYDEVKDRVRKEAFESASSARLESLLTVWKGDAEVVINEKVLRKTHKGEAPNPLREKY